MRLSSRHREIIEKVEADGYVWLSHLSVNAQMRFRNKVKKGFKGFMKVEQLTFLTPRVADMIRRGAMEKDAPRLSKKDQFEFLEEELVKLEKELFLLKGVGSRKEQVRFKIDA